MDVEDASAWLSVWWFELVAGVVAVGTGGSALATGDVVQVVVAVTLGVVTLDRIRLRMDNRTLGVVLAETRREGATDE